MFKAQHTFKLVIENTTNTARLVRPASIHVTELPFYCEAKLTPLLNLDLDCETARQRLRKPKNVGTKIVEFANRFKSACVD